jgi:voltage-gated potassium channel
MRQLSIADDDYKALNRSLPQVEFFATLSMSDIERLIKSIQMHGYSRGEIVFKQGTPADAFYIVYEGELAVLERRHLLLPDRKLAILTPGQFFGEMALLDRQPHSSTIKALSEVKVFVLLTSAFKLLCEGNPDFLKEVSSVSERRKFQNAHNDMFALR